MARYHLMMLLLEATRLFGGNVKSLYTVCDQLEVNYTSQKQKGQSTTNAVGGSYQVAPGLNVLAETSRSAA